MKKFKSILDLIQSPEEGQAVLAMLYAKLMPLPNVSCHVCMGWNDGKAGQWGHGKFKYKNVALYVHRTIWELEKGRVDPGLVLDHTCQLEPCCIVEHLEPVTMGVNTHRGPGRDYQYKQPHEYLIPFIALPPVYTIRQLDELFELKDRVLIGVDLATGIKGDL